MLTENHLPFLRDVFCTVVGAQAWEGVTSDVAEPVWWAFTLSAQLTPVGARHGAVTVPGKLLLRKINTSNKLNIKVKIVKS